MSVIPKIEEPDSDDLKDMYERLSQGGLGLGLKATRASETQAAPWLLPPMTSISRLSGVSDSLGSRRSVPSSTNSAALSQSSPVSDLSTRIVPAGESCACASRNVQNHVPSTRIRSVNALCAP